MRPLVRLLSLLWPAAVAAWLWTREPVRGTPWANGDLLPMLKAAFALWTIVYLVSSLPDWWHGVAIRVTAVRAAGRATVALLVAVVLFFLWTAVAKK